MLVSRGGLLVSESPKCFPHHVCIPPPQPLQPRHVASPPPPAHRPASAWLAAPGCNPGRSATRWPQQAVHLGLRAASDHGGSISDFSEMPIINDHCPFLLGHEKAGSTHNRKSNRSRFPAYEMSASGGNDIHPEALKIDAKTQASSLWRLEKQGELRAEMTLASHVCGRRAMQGFRFIFFLRDKKKVKLRRVSTEGLCSLNDDLVICKIQRETKRGRPSLPCDMTTASQGEPERAECPLPPRLQGAGGGSLTRPARPEGTLGTTETPASALSVPHGSHYPYAGIKYLKWDHCN